MPERQQESSENGLAMLHLNLRGYWSHIAETIALTQGMDAKLFNISLNETLLTKAIENIIQSIVILQAEHHRQKDGAVAVHVLVNLNRHRVRRRRHYARENG